MTSSILPRAGLILAAGLSISAAAHAVPWTLQVRNAAGQPLADAIVAVEIKDRPAKAPAGTRAEMGQRERQFTPQLLVVQTGTAVSFPNFDTVRHHVYSFSPIKVIDIKLYSGTPAEPIVFDKPGVATLGCNIHDRMSAHIVVVDTPVFGRSGAAGNLQLDLPPGEHVLKAWHASLKTPALLSRSVNVGTSAGQSVVSLAE